MEAMVASKGTALVGCGMKAWLPWVSERVGEEELCTAARNDSSEELCWKGEQKIGAVLGGEVFWFPQELILR